MYLYQMSQESFDSKIGFLKFHLRAAVYQKSYLAALLAFLPNLCNQTFPEMELTGVMKPRLV